MAGQVPAYCFDCRSNVRGSFALHLSTRKHRERTAPPRPKRRSQLSYQVREGTVPSYMLAGDREPFYLWEEDEEE